LAESILEFLQGIFGDTNFARFLIVFLISLLPGVGGPATTIPIGVVLLELPIFAVTLVCMTGNILPVPFIIFFIRKIFDIMRKLSKRLGAIADKFEEKAKSRASRLEKGAFIGLFVFVAIPLPLPGMGAWTGALIAAILNVRMRIAFPAIALGVLVASLITVGVTLGLITFLG